MASAGSLPLPEPGMMPSSPTQKLAKTITRLPTNQPTTDKYCTIATTAITIYHTKPGYYHHYLPHYTLSLPSLLHTNYIPSAPLPHPLELSQKTPRRTVAKNSLRGYRRKKPPLDRRKKPLSPDTVAKKPHTFLQSCYCLEKPLLLSQKTQVPGEGIKNCGSHLQIRHPL